MEDTYQKSAERSLKFILRDKTGECHVTQGKDGPDLGLVQGVTVRAAVGEITRAVVETICTEAEIEILEKNTELIVTVREDDAYNKGRDAGLMGTSDNTYRADSYAYFMYERGVKDGLYEKRKKSEEIIKATGEIPTVAAKGITLTDLLKILEIKNTELPFSESKEEVK